MFNSFAKLPKVIMRHRTIRDGRFISALVLALAVVGASAFGASPAELLRRSEEADKRVSYRGIKKATLAFGDRVTVAMMKVIHLKPDLTRTIYFSPAAMAGIVVIRDGPEGWKYDPKKDVWEPIGRCNMQCGEMILREALRNYDIRLIGTDRVAGRDAYVLHALPKFRTELAHRMWVDCEHFLIVGTQTETYSGTVIRSSRYLTLQINPSDINPDLFRVRGRISRPSADVCSPDFKFVKPSYLPKGYRLEATRYFSLKGSACVHLQFTNGVNTISIFQHKAGKEEFHQKIESKVTNVLTWTRDGIQFTILGDLPRAELQKIADSVK
ncbi:MAG: MucB/RseB C-terminal domain-containing protein [Armatimonadetes bacterium]|nr:MucB/RseB C-terminal domain-containing protein [Armatimonadota bacterium]